MREKWKGEGEGGGENRKTDVTICLCLSADSHNDYRYRGARYTRLNGFDTTDATPKKSRGDERSAATPVERDANDFAK